MSLGQIKTKIGKEKDFKQFDKYNFFQNMYYYGVIPGNE